MNNAAVVQIASELKQLLLPQHPAQAEFVGSLGQSVAERDIPTATRMFSSFEMWGGSGSVAEINLPTPAANEKLNELLVQLVKHFGDAGIAYSRATVWASIFKEWQEKGIFRR
jgi:hypothetical protein